jgi:riboflavin kinase / FMN adenylyltransferase
VYRWQGLDEVPAGWSESVVTIGVFDGVHRGHQRIVQRAAELGTELGLPVVAITFDPHPDEVIRPGSHPPFLCSARRRAELLAGLGVDAVCVLPFTLDFSRIDPDEFVRTVLVEKLHAAAVVVGEDFRFGHKATGDVPLLDKLGEKYEYTAEGLPLLVLDDMTISSTVIRTLLTAGDVAQAARLLGRPHRVEGVVVRGHQRGRQLGFPTANVESPPHTAVPADGIYAGWLETLDEAGEETSRWPAAISIGTNPTFNGQLRTVEAYALDRTDLDLYGLHAAIDFAVRLRGTLRFESVGALVDQMRIDVDQARALLTGSTNDRSLRRRDRGENPDGNAASARHGPWYCETLTGQVPVRAGCTLIAAVRYGETRTLSVIFKEPRAARCRSKEADLCGLRDQ